MRNRLASQLLALVLAVLSADGNATTNTISGTVHDSDGNALAGAFVTARDTTRGTAFTVTTQTDGSYQLTIPDGQYMVRARAYGYRDLEQPHDTAADGSGMSFSLSPIPDATMQMPAFVFLNCMPEGAEKRRLIVDCMGCHPMNQHTIYRLTGGVFSEEEFHKSTEKMLAFAGATTPFPVMSADREAAGTAKFLAESLKEEAIAQQVTHFKNLRAPNARYHVTEYDLPEQKDFPHDLMLDKQGNVLVTGMYSGRMYILDPETGAFTTEAIPTPMANPRALDVDENGDWWILCGMPKKIAHYAVAEKEWNFFDIGMYPHSVKVDQMGRVWFNGHFTNNPIEMGYVDSKTGDVRRMEVPDNPMPEEQGGPIPYGLRVGPDGTVWATELAGNRLIRVNPEKNTMETYHMPTPHSGPRRLDVDKDGIVWIPEFAAGKLARFDPATDEMTEYDFPTPNSLPYCARVHHETGMVWISQCGNDAIARFDPATETVTEFRLPTHTTFIRHMDIDQATGDVWSAYSHAPSLHPRIARLRAE